MARTVSEHMIELLEPWLAECSRRAVEQLQAAGAERVSFCGDFELGAPALVPGAVYTVTWEGHSVLPPYERTEHEVCRMQAELTGIDADGLEQWRLVPVGA